MGNVHGSGNFCNFNFSLVGSEEICKVFLKRKDACKGRRSFLWNFNLRSRDGAFCAAAGPAAASVRLEDQDGLLAAAALVDSGELGGAEIEGRYLVNSMHDSPNSSGLGTDAASAGAATEGEFLCDALHGTSNSLGVNADAFLKGAFWLHDFEGHGPAAGVLGDTGSAFSTGSLIRGSCNNSLHPIHACAHSCLDGCGGGGWGRGVGVACPSLCLSVGVNDDEDVASMGGSNSLIQGSVCHANACAGSDALLNSRQVRGHCLRGGTKCTSTGSRDQGLAF